MSEDWNPTPEMRAEYENFVARIGLALWGAKITNEVSFAEMAAGLGVPERAIRRKMMGWIQGKGHLRTSEMAAIAHVCRVRLVMQLDDAQPTKAAGLAEGGSDDHAP